MTEISLPAEYRDGGSLDFSRTEWIGWSWNGRFYRFSANQLCTMRSPGGQWVNSPAQRYRWGLRLWQIRMEKQMCDAKMHPFTDDTELVCGLQHDPQNLNDDTKHTAVLEDYAFPGSRQEFSWFEGDRRTFRGEWLPCGTREQGSFQRLCVLPKGHRMDGSGHAF